MQLVSPYSIFWEILSPHVSKPKRAPRYGQYLTHAHNHITRAVATIDSCFALVGTHQHGIAVGSMIWLCACVRYWPYRGVDTCASVQLLCIASKHKDLCGDKNDCFCNLRRQWI